MVIIFVVFSRSKVSCRIDAEQTNYPLIVEIWSKLECLECVSRIGRLIDKPYEAFCQEIRTLKDYLPYQKLNSMGERFQGYVTWRRYKL